MSTSPTHCRRHADYELRFRCLFKPGRGYSFPCDSSGRVDIDALTDRARNNYYFARTTIGSEFAMPVVQLSDFH
jgi:hypothetical protein